MTLPRDRNGLCGRYPVSSSSCLYLVSGFISCSLHMLEDHCGL
ncbi:hypothetical protein CTAM01_13819 [Colletotrichum tamarilloi]|uniref:Uncharacterized protein n=1 Tax=Colletotrichum tamarilloi TaxID=1209934 RepID=A0ABQ9QR58_9PEZI|nr:uncharacterized protein CTAM01_13819 [Colletotrichum tamarilloi]KAK1481884.1 hypothetical protein CTAM01_13819 [Colletotrichum tamarilloi]